MPSSSPAGAPKVHARHWLEGRGPTADQVDGPTPTNVQLQSAYCLGSRSGGKWAGLGLGGHIQKKCSHIEKLLHWPQKISILGLMRGNRESFGSGEMVGL
ncbi:unnamed protein product [Linum trigynum]|uniref:Uncharacterized protein n=1 Tax=Linum trigynum TaxID=586398 RepID=A0AAV2FD25_9ROSI